MSDFERPLNDRGRRDAPVMAARLYKLRRAPELLVSSPALRAITTAQIFAERFGVRAGNIQLIPQIYEAGVDVLTKLARNFDPQVRHVLMFGHNPGFSDFARWLATCPFSEMPTCAVASIELQIGDWRELGPGCGRLASYLYPKDDTD